MKNLRFGILLVVISAFMLHAGIQSGSEEFLEIDRLSDRVIVIKSPCAGMINNIVAINSEKGIVVVDTHISPSFASLVRKKIEEVFQRNEGMDAAVARLNVMRAQPDNQNAKRRLAELKGK